jgi:hypothetical protein
MARRWVVELLEDSFLTLDKSLFAKAVDNVDKGIEVFLLL